MSEKEYERERDHYLSKCFLKDKTHQEIKIPKEISEQKHIVETYAMLEKAVEQSIDGIAVADMNGIIRFCNRAWAYMHGYCISELLGKHLNIFHTQDQMVNDVIPFNEKVKKNGSYHGEVGHVRKNGEIFSTWMTTTILKDEKGRSVGLVGIARDISERKKILEALALSEERYRKLFEKSIEGIGISKQNRVIAANKALLDIFGYDDIEELKKIPLLDHVAPEFRELIRERMEKRKNGESVAPRLEYKIIRKNGEIRDIEISSVEIVIENEKYVQSTFRDITEHKKVEEALKTQSLILESMTEGVNVADENGNIVFNNSALEAMFGYKQGELIGKHVSILNNYPLEESMRIIKEVIDHLNRYGSWSGEFKNRKKDGSQFYTYAKITALKISTRKLWVTVQEDITERKKSEKQQIVITTGLRAVVLAADEFISCSDAETVFRRAVEFAREKFGLERCAIFAEDGGYVRGIYGTDRHGRTTDERAHCFEKNEVWKKRLRMLDPRDPNWVVVREPQLEWDGKNTVQIGEGWIVITPIHSAHGQIGVFVNDAAISGAKLDPMKQDTLAVFCSLIGNIVERKRVENKMEALNKRLIQTSRRFRQLALRDSHTGLYNHRYLTEMIETEFNRAKRYGYSLSVIMMDLDYFKSINDVYGHQFGDLVLKQFAKHLKRLVRQYDILVRFGGEEFVVICPGIDRATALTLAQGILDSVYLCNFGNDQHGIKLKLSVAVVSFPEDNINSGMDLINIADKILNKVKEDGGDRVYTLIDTEKIQSDVLEKQENNTSVKFLQEKLEKLTKRANQSLIESIFAFAKTIKLKDHYTGEHVENSVSFAVEIAKRLDLPERKIEQVKEAAQLHDLGKIGISDKILLKKSKLTKVEFEEIKKHPLIGADILRPIQFLHDIVPLILYHHERWDGNGYPYGLRQEQIPIGARIIALADVYHALISDRPYRTAYTKSQAMRLIKAGSGTQFDPKIVDTFLSLV